MISTENTWSGSKEAKLFPVETKRVVGPGAGCGPHLTGVARFEQEPLINVESSKINPAFDRAGSILGVVEFSSIGFRTLSPERAARQGGTRYAVDAGAGRWSGTGADESLAQLIIICRRVFNHGVTT